MCLLNLGIKITSRFILSRRILQALNGSDLILVQDINLFQLIDILRRYHARGLLIYLFTDKPFDIISFIGIFNSSTY